MVNFLISPLPVLPTTLTLPALQALPAITRSLTFIFDGEVKTFLPGVFIEISPSCLLGH